jgi:tRNA pseudouridine38-40 synthase
MERYQIILAYDGTDFLGFQRQGKKNRTVQLVVEDALRTLGWAGESILSAGRTDTGVHASGQVIAVDLAWRHSVQALAQALNARLPQDVAVRDVKAVPADFHPRFHAHRRTYQYQIVIDRFPHPLRDRFVWRLDNELDEPLLHQAAKYLIGTYDCAVFGSPPKKGGSTMRTIYGTEWKKLANNAYEFTITANAYLYHMVRRVVFLQVNVARQRLGWENFQQGIDRRVALPGGLAPAKGLCLVNVDYESPRNESIESQ